LIEERITVVQRLDPAGAMVLANRSQLEQMVTQLLLNARDAIRDGFGSIVISTSQGTSSVLLRVADSGVGMTKEVQRRIFEPFFTTHRDIGRAGLGLATVRTAINNAGGSINVESTVGVGSAFEIWLPRIES
jgi:signal transduction histidine kinase